MTTAIAHETQRRRAGRPARKVVSAAGIIATHLEYVALSAKALSWPATKYQSRPSAFAREILGVEPWEKQCEILEAVRDHKRVAVKSGHKVGKSNSAAILALWFVCSYEDARVVMSSTTSRQVDQILWRELRKMHARAGTCVACKKAAAAEHRPPPRPCEHSNLVGGDIHELARSGLKFEDFREVVGFTAREAEAVAGVSGANLLYLLDEASGIPESIYEAIEGNRAGGAKIALWSNPTRTEGEFFAAFHEKEQFYKTITISSEETPNVKAGKIIIPGLATREWIEEKKLEWGEDSALYKVRVQGEFVLGEDGKILTVHAIGEAEERWDTTPATGRLHVGIDPAGPGNAGDETAFAPRRGNKVLRVWGKPGLTKDDILAHALGILTELREPGDELPVLVVDREGPIGAELFYFLIDYADKHPGLFEVAGIRASDRAHRQPHIYDRMRDELLANLAQWVREGGAIPEDTRLAKELHAPEWVTLVTGRLKATPKDEVRKILGRSPDRADAVALAVWTPITHREPGGPAPHARDAYEALPTNDTVYGAGDDDDGETKDPVYG